MTDNIFGTNVVFVFINGSYWSQYWSVEYLLCVVVVVAIVQMHGYATVNNPHFVVCSSMLQRQRIKRTILPKM